MKRDVPERHRGLYAKPMTGLSQRSAGDPVSPKQGLPAQCVFRRLASVDLSATAACSQKASPNQSAWDGRPLPLPASLVSLPPSKSAWIRFPQSLEETMGFMYTPFSKSFNE